MKSFYPEDKGFMSFVNLIPGILYRCSVHHEVHNVVLKYPALNVVHRITSVHVQMADIFEHVLMGK